jgi:hypothetical protein
MMARHFALSIGSVFVEAQMRICGGGASSLAMAVFALGCGTTATISRADGSQVTGDIVRGDRQNIYLSTVAGGTTKVRKKEVTDVDHPGDAATIVGLALTAVGLISLVASECQYAENKGQCQALSVSPAMVGIPMVLWGIGVHSGSESAMGSAGEKQDSGWDLQDEESSDP